MKDKKTIGKYFVRPFWYSQEHVSVNAPKHVDYISLKLYGFHTLTEKQFERGKNRNVWDIYADFNHQKTQDVKLSPRLTRISHLSRDLTMALCGQISSCSGGTDFVLKLEPDSLWVTLIKLQTMWCWYKKVKMIFCCCCSSEGLILYLEQEFKNKPLTNSVRCHLREVPRVVEFIETESGRVVSRSQLRGRLESSCLISTKSQLQKMKKFWKWIVVMALKPQNCSLNFIKVIDILSRQKYDY